MLVAVMSVVPIEKLVVHFHDTYGQSLANILISLQDFSDPRDADDARYHLDGRDFVGSRIIVEFAKGNSLTEALKGNPLGEVVPFAV
ncbi:hypothetical protein RIF29_16677 [Crotalaria pallida]|uniref:Uncharacterized protein n=1 Tax=Crotalaria pallida TaxID=3830 RepID=A0AAN9IC94_CROPI